MSWVWAISMASVPVKLPLLSVASFSTLHFCTPCFCTQCFCILCFCALCFCTEDGKYSFQTTLTLCRILLYSTFLYSVFLYSVWQVFLSNYPYSMSQVFVLCVACFTIPSTENVSFKSFLLCVACLSPLRPMICVASFPVKYYEFDPCQVQILWQLSHLSNLIHNVLCITLSLVVHLFSGVNLSM